MESKGQQELGERVCVRELGGGLVKLGLYYLRFGDKDQVPFQTNQFSNSSQVCTVCSS